MLGAWPTLAILQGVFAQAGGSPGGAEAAAAAPLPAVAPPAALPAAGLITSVLQAGPGEKAIMVCLALFSIVSWGIIFQKLRSLQVARRESEVFLEAFWGTKRLDVIFTRAESLVASPVSQVFRAGYVELGKIRKGRSAEQAAASADEGSLQSIGRSMQRAALQEMAQLEAMLPYLATVGSTAPFIGLLGTVLGIISAFYDIGAVGNANLATVAPGIGGALVATAAGLFAAIPAVMAYNYFLARLRGFDAEMQTFAADFLNIVRRHFV